MSGMYNRFCEDVSDDLFDSVYNDLYSLAEEQQKSIWKSANTKKRNRLPYYVGEHQDMLNAWCMGKASLGECLDYIKIHKRG